MIGQCIWLISIPPKHSVSAFIGYLKGEKRTDIFEKNNSLKYKYGNRHFGA